MIWKLTLRGKNCQYNIIPSIHRSEMYLIYALN